MVKSYYLLFWATCLWTFFSWTCLTFPLFMVLYFLDWRYRAWHYEWQFNHSCSLLSLLYPRTVDLPFIVSSSVCEMSFGQNRTPSWCKYSTAVKITHKYCPVNMNSFKQALCIFYKISSYHARVKKMEQRVGQVVWKSFLKRTVFCIFWFLTS